LWRRPRPKLGCGVKERKKKSRVMRWVRHIACKGKMRSAYSILVGKPEGKRPL
jgi:hypothetical protein